MKFESLQDLVGRQIKAIVAGDDGSIELTLAGESKVRFSAKDRAPVEAPDSDYAVVAQFLKPVRKVTWDSQPVELG